MEGLNRRLWPGDTDPGDEAVPLFAGWARNDGADENAPPTPRSTAPRPSPAVSLLRRSNSKPVAFGSSTPARAGSFSFSDMSMAKAGTPSQLARTPARTPLRPRTNGPATPLSRAARTPSDAGKARAAGRAKHVRQAAVAQQPAAPPLEPQDGLASIRQLCLDDSDENVKVCIRVRPRTPAELNDGAGSCLTVTGGKEVALRAHPEPQFFTFDFVAPESTSQADIFQVAGKPIVKNCLDGYNSCIFAYGQTGSGKTHTMMGKLPEEYEDDLDVQAGLIVRVFKHLFDAISADVHLKGSDNVKYICKVSMIEIYNETIFDLLSSVQSQCYIREDIKHGVHMEGQVEEQVFSVLDIVKLLQKGSQCRHVGETKMNRESSRSHCVFTCALESRSIDNGITSIRHSRLNLVDLAGSERQKATGAAGERLKEASNINKSLSVLGLVIMSLVEMQHGKQRHIPYRDSKLTFLLQDSLGGNSKTVMIANISPTVRNYGETLSTLRFAQRAKHIRNKAVVNQDTSGDAPMLRQEILKLKAELADYKAKLNVTHALATSPVLDQALLGALNSPLSNSPLMWSRSPGNSTHVDAQILKGALRRENMAIRELGFAKSQLADMSSLLTSKDKDTQRMNMIVRLREGKIKRLEASQMSNGASSDWEAEKKELMEELQIWKEKAEHPPEVTRFAMENLQLKESLASLKTFVASDGEREQLHGEISMLRDKVLELLDAQRSVSEVEEAAAVIAAANAARVEEAAAQAQAAMLRSQKYEQVSAQLAAMTLENDKLTDELKQAQKDAASAMAAAHAQEYLLTDLRCRLTDANCMEEMAMDHAEKLQLELSRAQIALEERHCELLDATVEADRSMQRHVDTIRMLENEVENRRNTIEILQAALDDTTCEKSNIIEEKKRLQLQTTESHEALRALRSELATLSAVAENNVLLESELVHAEICAANMKSELMAMTQETEYHRAEAAARQLEARVSEAQTEAIRRENAQLLERLKELLMRCNQDISLEGLVESEDILHVLENGIADLAQQLSRAQREAWDADAIAVQYMDELDLCNKDLLAARKDAALATSRTEAELQLCNSEIESLSQELQYVSVKSTELEAANKQAEELAQRAEAAFACLITSCRNALQIPISEVGLTTENVASISKQIELFSNTMKGRILQVLEIANDHNGSVALCDDSQSIESMLDTLQARIEEIVGGIRDCSADLCGQILSMGQAERRVQELKTELEAVTGTLHQLRQREMSLNSDLHAERLRVRELILKLETGKVCEERAQLAIIDASSQTESANPMDENSSQYQYLETELQRYIDKIKELDAKVVLRDHEIKELTSTNERFLEGISEKYEQRISLLEKQRSMLQDELAVQEEIMLDMAASEAESRSHVEHKKQELEALIERLKSHEQREMQLEGELTKLAGQHNMQQRIHHMQKVKDENCALRAELSAAREEVRWLSRKNQGLQEHSECVEDVVEDAIEDAPSDVNEGS